MSWCIYDRGDKGCLYCFYGKVHKSWFAKLPDGLISRFAYEGLCSLSNGMVFGLPPMGCLACSIPKLNRFISSALTYYGGTLDLDFDLLLRLSFLFSVLMSMMGESIIGFWKFFGSDSLFVCDSSKMFGAYMATVVKSDFWDEVPYVLLSVARLFLDWLACLRIGTLSCSL